MIELTKFCKNCGCQLNENELYCPDCGKATGNRHVMKYCPNCGEEIDHDERFCRNCGIELKKPEVKTESMLDKYRIPLIILAVIFAIVIVAFGAFSALGTGSVQEVHVDSIGFTIPDYFEEDTHLKVNDNDSGLIYKSKFWQSDSDYIQIDVMYSEQYVDAREIADYMGGEKATMIGHDGYYNELEDSYSFSLVESNKLVTVYTSDYNLLGQIKSS